KLQPEDEIALMAFRAKSALVQSFTKDRKVIADRLRDFTEDAARLDLGYGQDRVNAVFQAAEQLDKSAHPLHRRIVIVVTDDTQAFVKGATDIAAQMVASTGCTVYGFVANGSNPAKKNTVKRAVIESAISSFGNPVSFAINLGTRLGTQAALDALLKDRSFNQVVIRSGGALSRADGEAASDEIGALFSQLHNRYLIGFSPAGYTGGERYHELKLGLNPAAQKRASDVILVTAKGYFARRTE
ncbi:MAG: VWA domain-containing protein, partial [Blastocatellia bacterium]